MTQIINPGAPDLRTSVERRREELRDDVCRSFLASYAANPTFSPNRHMEVLARRYELTTMGVKYMLTSRGIYRSNGRSPIIVITAL